MKSDLDHIWKSKRERRQRLAALPFEEKLHILERLRERSAAIATSHLRQHSSGNSVSRGTSPIDQD